MKNLREASKMVRDHVGNPQDPRGMRLDRIDDIRDWLVQTQEYLDKTEEAVLNGPCPFFIFKYVDHTLSPATRYHVGCEHSWAKEIEKIVHRITSGNEFMLDILTAIPLEPDIHKFQVSYCFPGSDRVYKTSVGTYNQIQKAMDYIGARVFDPIYIPE